MAKLRPNSSRVIRSVTENGHGGVNTASRLDIVGQPEYRDIVIDQDNKESLEANPVTTQAVREYLAHIWRKYQVASKKQKGVFLDELCRNLDVHRKAAIRLMRSPYKPRSRQGFQGGRKKRYSEESKYHLELLWKAMGYPAPVRMKAMMTEWVEYHDHKAFNAEIKAELVRMSEASIKRFLTKARAELARKRNTGTRKGLRKYLTQVPIRDLGTTPIEPGHCEIDCVAHCGDSLSGEFVWTLNLTDIATGWTECEAVWGKNGVNICKALGLMEKRLPFDIKALYCDNGSEFMNRNLIEKFAKKDRKTPLQIFRSRPYKKNDQAYVEQKNYTHIRSLFGYGRIDWAKSVNGMNNIYRKEWRELQNYFLAQQKLINKVRIGSKIKRKMGKPQTPFCRLIDQLEFKQRRSLEKAKAALNPVKLRRSQLAKTRTLFGYYKNSITLAERGKMAI